MAGGTAPVVVKRSGAVVEVVLNRPDRRNALSASSISALSDAFAGLAGSDAGAVLLRGEQGFFCSGLDLGEVDPSGSVVEAWTEVHCALDQVGLPLIACLEGGAINAGAALALACDLMVAGENSYLQVMEAAMGVTPPVNAAWLALRFPAAVGRQLALSCRRFTGPDLHRMGVALDVVGDDETLGHARRLAERIASYPASAAIRTKRILRQTSGEIDGFSAVVARTAPVLPSLEADPS